MNRYYLLLVGASMCFSYSFAQDRDEFNERFNKIDTELKNWDPVRGAWLSSSINAMAHDEPVPVRQFPENLTPHQLMSQVPDNVRARIENDVTLASTNAPETERDAWNRVDNFVQSSGCSRVSGRSYGDPHLVSFDGARYSFQTVGEFNFAKSSDGSVIVQTRQKAQNECFSLNTAVAMNVAGDRVCIYASDYPDNDYSSPIRVNGASVDAKSRTYFLDNGGTIRFEGNTYVIDWPTGESLTARVSQSSGMNFVDLNMIILPCNKSFSGLMGNANNDQRDDFNTTAGVAPIRVLGGTNDMFEQAHQEFLSKDFAETHRITQAQSLFDYPIGQSTFSFTDRSFPHCYRNMNDINDVDRQRATSRCRDAGVAALDMNGCVYDNVYLSLPPSTPPVVSNPVSGKPLTPVTNPRPNGNPAPMVPPTKEPPTGPQPPIDTFIGHDDDGGGKIPVEIREETTPVNQKDPVFEDSRPQTSSPSEPRERPIFTPKPQRETTTPRPSTPKPSVPRPSTPKPSTPRPSAPKPSIRPGGRG